MDPLSPAHETSFDGEKCLDCPLQIFCQEEADALRKLHKTGDDEAAANQWEIYAKTIQDACSNSEPYIAIQKRWRVVGPEVIKVTCASPLGRQDKRGSTLFFPLTQPPTL